MPNVTLHALAIGACALRAAGVLVDYGQSMKRRPRFYLAIGMPRDMRTRVNSA